MPRTFPVSQLLARLGIPGEVLVTAEYGQEAYPILADELHQTHDYLILDFHGVRVVDTSFARESLLRLLDDVIQRRFGEVGVLIINASKDIFTNLDDMMSRRKQKGFFLVRRNDELDIAGNLEPNLLEVLNLLRKSKELTAREAADLLGLEVNTASTRLKKLHDFGATVRYEETTESGRQHVYRLLGD